MPASSDHLHLLRQRRARRRGCWTCCWLRRPQAATKRRFGDAMETKKKKMIFLRPGDEHSSLGPEREKETSRAPSLSLSLSSFLSGALSLFPESSRKLILETALPEPKMVCRQQQTRKTRGEREKSFSRQFFFRCLIFFSLLFLSYPLPSYSRTRARRRRRSSRRRCPRMSRRAGSTTRSQASRGRRFLWGKRW